MDSRTWHRQCSAPEPSEPEVFSKADWARLSDAEVAARRAELRRWLRSVYFETPELAEASAVLSSVVDANSETPPGAKQIVAVTGPNALGKSTLVKRWARLRYHDWVGAENASKPLLPVWRPSPGLVADLCPVVWVNLHSSARIKEFDAQFLEFFRLPSEGIIRSLSTRMVRAAARHGVRVLVVDDAHLLKTNWKGGRDVLDHVKHINTELGEQGASLVLVGANLGGGDIATDPQIAGRLNMVALPVYGVTSEEGRRQWQRLLLDMEERLLPHLPAGRPGMLESQLAGRLWKRTQGYLGDVARLVVEAAILANADGTHRITAEHVAAVRLSSRAEEAEQVLGSRGWGAVVE